MTRSRKIIVVLAAGTLTLVLARALPATWRGIHERRYALEDQAALLARAREDVASEQNLVDSATALRTRVEALASRILSGGTSTQAAAALVGALTHALPPEQARILASDPVADSARAGDLQRISLRTTLETDLEGLIHLLKSLAAEPAVITVDQIRILAADPFTPDTQAETMNIELVLAGWFLAAERER